MKPLIKKTMNAAQQEICKKSQRRNKVEKKYILSI